MKIALFGTSNSGKTTYFSGMYHKHNTALSAPLQSQGRADQCVMHIRFNDDEKHKLFHANAERLVRKPIEFPEKTDSLNRATITAQFDFKTATRTDEPEAAAPNNASHSYERQIEIYDPPGEAFNATHRQSASILLELSWCDLAIVFIPSHVLLEEIDGADVDDDTLSAIRIRTCLDEIYRLVEQLSKKLESNDVFPVCFVLSKYDLIPAEKDALIKRVFFEQLLMPFSSRYSQFVVCGCTTSVCDGEKFRAANLGWPFLFAAGGSIFRNSYRLRMQAANASNEASAQQEKANKLWSLREESGFFGWLKYVFVEEGVYEEERDKASSRYSQAGELSKAASDDAKLGSDIWSMISAERRNNIRVYKNGQAYDPNSEGK